MICTKGSKKDQPICLPSQKQCVAKILIMEKQHCSIEIHGCWTISTYVWFHTLRDPPPHSWHCTKWNEMGQESSTSITWCYTHCQHIWTLKSKINSHLQCSQRAMWDPNLHCSNIAWLWTKLLSLQTRLIFWSSVVNYLFKAVSATIYPTKQNVHEFL